MAVVFDGPLLGGRYRLGPRLGSGGQGRTFLARDEKSVGGEKRVAVKQLRLGAESGWKRFDLFERELRTLKSLDHDGIPRFIAYFEEPPGTHYIVMEKAPGATLQAISKKVRFTDEELVDVLSRTLELLDYLHGRRPPVIHRDIKPANLLRDADGKISLVDFGGVLEAIREEGGSTVVGTFGYMAPEQLHGAAGPATDLYGLGATIVALAGCVEPEKVPRKGLKMDLDRHLPSMGKPLVKLLKRMTDPDPEGRPATAEQALAELAKLKLKLKLPEAEPEPEPESPAKPPKEARPLVDEDDILPNDGSIPGPIHAALLVLLFFVGVFGTAAFYVFDVALAPLGFALARAFVAPPRRAQLRERERKFRESLQGAREGFRALTHRGASEFRRRRLAPRPPRPRLPPRRRGER